MPGQMDRNACRIHPRPFGRRKKFEAFLSTPLHLHYMGDGMNGAWMSRVDCQRTTCHRFGRGESWPFSSRPKAYIARTLAYAGTATSHWAIFARPISQHAPLAETEVKRMRDHERDNIAWPKLLRMPP